jgi:hypothetical protein
MQEVSMKLVKWICFCCLSVSLSAVAAEKAEKTEKARKLASTLNLTGKKAQSLYEALSDLGIGEGHAGSASVEVDQLDCAQKGRAAGKVYYTCTFKNEDGPEQDVKGKEARALYKALEQAGAQSDCGMGTCGIGGLTIHCDARGISGGDKTTYSCSLK